MSRYRSQRGETIIGVIMAITIFSMVAVGALTVMNHAVSASQRSLEITLVRQQIDTQAETIRLIHAEHIAGGSSAWASLVQDAVPSASQFELGEGSTCPAIPATYSYALNPSGLSTPVNLKVPVQPARTAGAPPYARLVVPQSGPAMAYGLWIEPVDGGVDASQPATYYDFHIRACWDTVGQNVPITLGTIVRLHVPR